jgi:glutaredoxin 3
MSKSLIKQATSKKSGTFKEFHMQQVKVYTWSSCPFCIRAKQFLVQKGVEFEEIVLDGKDDELQALRERTGFRTVPQIFIGEEMIGGFTEMMSLEQSGELESKLNGQN